MRATTLTPSLRSNTLSTGTASRRRDEEIEVHTTVPTTHPMVRVGSIRMAVRMVAIGGEDRLVAITEVVDFMEDADSQAPHLFHPLRYLRHTFLRT